MDEENANREAILKDIPNNDDSEWYWEDGAMSRIVRDFGSESFKEIEIFFLVAEATASMYTIARLHWTIDAMGTLTSTFYVYTTPISQYGENVYVIAYDIIFYILLVINIYLYISEEH